jgi:voltage-gated potassium channel
MPLVDPLKKHQYSLLILFVIMILGTLGYMVLEGWNLVDSLYMTMITISTIGFREVHEMDMAGRLFTILLIIGGVGTVAYALKTAIQVLLEGEIRGILGRKKVNEKIKRLTNHYIICGYGRMGKHICGAFADEGSPFVVIEKNPDVVTEIQEKGCMVIQGDATHDEIMATAGIERAKGLISVVNSDAENLYVVLSARGLSPNLHIVTRAGDEGAEKKLKRAGANLVVSPYVIGAQRITQTIFRPHVTSFLDTAVRGNANIDFRLESIQIGEGSGYNGMPIGRSKIREELGVLIVAIEKQDGTLNTSLSPETILEKGDRLICVGKPAQMAELARLTGSPYSA